MPGQPQLVEEEGYHLSTQFLLLNAVLGGHLCVLVRYVVLAYQILKYRTGPSPL